MLRGGAGRHKLRVQPICPLFLRSRGVPRCVLAGGDLSGSGFAVELAPLSGNGRALHAEALGFGELGPGLDFSPEATEGPGAPEVRRREARALHEDGVVRRKCAARITPQNGDGSEAEMALRRGRIGPKSGRIRVLGRSELAGVHPQEPKSVPHFGVVRAAPGGLFEARSGPFDFTPVSRPHPAFARPARIVRRDLGRVIVHLEGLVVSMSELVGVPELDERQGVIFAELLRQSVDFAAHGRKIAGQSQHADEQAATRDVVVVASEVFPQNANGVRLTMLARERRGPLPRRRCARRASHRRH
jgi:hypothetical protein